MPPSPLALPEFLASRLDAKYGRRCAAAADDDARSACDGDADDDDGGLIVDDVVDDDDGDGAVLCAPLCADGRTALVLALGDDAAADPGPTHVRLVRDAVLTASLEDLPAAVRTFWRARFDTADDGARTPRDVACDGVLLGRVADARVGECLVAAARLDPSLARADHVAASWLRAAVRMDARAFGAWQRLHGEDSLAAEA